MGKCTLLQGLWSVLLICRDQRLVIGHLCMPLVMGSASQRTREKATHVLSPGATGPVTRGSKKVSQLGTHCCEPGKWEGTVGNTGGAAMGGREAAR